MWHAIVTSIFEILSCSICNMNKYIHSDNYKKKEESDSVGPKRLDESSEDWLVIDKDNFEDCYRRGTKAALELHSLCEENKNVNGQFNLTNENKTESLAQDPNPSITNSENPTTEHNTSARLHEKDLSEPLKIKNQIGKNSEMNNVDDSTTTLHVTDPKAKPLIKCFKLQLEAACIVNPTELEILSIACEPIIESSSEPTLRITQDSSPSAEFEHDSKTISSLSKSSVTPVQFSPIQCISQNRIDQLIEKWKNSELVYHSLDYIDKTFFKKTESVTDLPISTEQAQALANLNDLPPEVNTPVNSNKRLPSTGSEERDTKRTKSLPFVVSTSSGNILGDGIFAEWQNRNYYFANIVDTLSDSRIKIVFWDSTFHEVARNQIFTELDKLMGHETMVSKESKNRIYHPGIIISCSIDKGTWKYFVATNNGDFEVHASQIYFTEHQAKLIKQEMDSVSLATNKIGEADLYPGCSGIQKDRHEKNDIVSSTRTALLHVTGCDIETSYPQNLNSSLKLKNVKGKIPKRVNKNEDSLLGPLRFKGSWFKDLYFLITCSTQAKIADEVQTNSPDYSLTTTPFVYDRLVQQIKLGAGQVINHFEDIHPTQYNKTYLITNAPCLTPKYLKCLAAGITIVCHEWIINCTIQLERLPLQELPAGWSVEKCCFINTSERKIPKPLSCLRIKIAQLNDEHFYKFWSEICGAVGATVSKFTGYFENTDVIVAENGIEDVKLDNAVAFGIPVVSASWVIQSIIHGEVRDSCAHPSYNHLHE